MMLLSSRCHFPPETALLFRANGRFQCVSVNRNPAHSPMSVAIRFRLTGVAASSDSHDEPSLRRANGTAEVWIVKCQRGVRRSSHDRGTCIPSRRTRQ